MKKITPLLFILLLIPLTNQSLFAQLTAEINGTVSDEDGEPIPNVSVALTNPEDEFIIKGTLTDSAGAFILSVDPVSYTLLISYISQRDHMADITVNAGDELDLGDIELVRWAGNSFS